MHLGIDITSLLYDRGVSRYTRNLLLALNNLPQMQFSLYGSSLRRRQDLVQQIKSLHLRREKHLLQAYPVSLLSKLWQSGLNSILPRLPGIEVFHAWDWHLPPDKTLPMVITIHDLAMLRMPHIAHPKVLRAHQIAWDRISHSKTQIIAVSQTTKRDIIELLNIDPRRVQVVYEALPEEVVTAGRNLTEDTQAKIIQKFALEKPFFLFVGTQEPRKNLSRIIRAWQTFAKDFDLVVAGATGWGTTNRSALRTEPIFLGPVSNLELAALYDQARLFLYPSLYEGFGLPILEAFHHGTPVITSNNSGMAEVAGNAAVLVDPLEEESIRDGITTILQEDRAAEKIRDQRMILRLQMFRWEDTAHQTLSVYQKTKQYWQT